MTKTLVCAAVLGVSVFGQDAVVEKKMAEAKAQLDGQVKIMSTSMIAGPTVKGAPYSAQAVNEMVQTLADGNRITNTSSTMLYRDSQGRERREEGGGREIVITDPVEGTSYVLDTRNKVARKSAPRTFSFSTGASNTTAGPVIMTDNHVFVTSLSGNGARHLPSPARRSGPTNRTGRPIIWACRLLRAWRRRGLVLR